MKFMSKLSIVLASMLTICDSYMVFASPDPECPEKNKEMSSIFGTAKNIEIIDADTYLVIETNDGESWVDIERDEIPKFEAVIGKRLNIVYLLDQYWSEGDEECRQNRKILRISIQNDAKDKNVKSVDDNLDNISQSTGLNLGNNEVTGIIRVEEGRYIKDPSYYYLRLPSGNEVFLGNNKKIWDNLDLRKCINFATNNGTPVTLKGEITEHDGKISFKNDDFTCTQAPYSSQYASYEGCYGPKIGGLQLGMSEASVKNVIGEYAQKNNIKYQDGSKSLGAGEDKFFDVGFFGKKTADRFAVGKNYFGVSDLQSKDFMQKFMREYNIPEVIPEKYQGLFGKPGIKYTYVNKKDGYSISIFPNEIMVDSRRK